MAGLEGVGSLKEKPRQEQPGLSEGRRQYAGSQNLKPARIDQKECTSSPGGGISAAPCGSWACAIASGLKLSRSSLISPSSATKYPVGEPDVPSLTGKFFDELRVRGFVLVAVADLEAASRAIAKYVTKPKLD